MIHYIVGTNATEVWTRCTVYLWSIPQPHALLTLAVRLRVIWQSTYNNLQSPPLKKHHTTRLAVRGDERVIRQRTKLCCCWQRRGNMLTRLAIVYWLIYQRHISHDTDNKTDHYNIIAWRLAVVWRIGKIIQRHNHERRLQLQTRQLEGNGNGSDAQADAYCLKDTVQQSILAYDDDITSKSKTLRSVVYKLALYHPLYHEQHLAI